MRPIIVIDDHELAHSGIRLLLADSAHFRLAGCFIRAADGIAFASVTPGAIVMLDLELPDIDGLSALGEIRSRNLADVVIMTGVTAPDMLRKAVELGAQGVVCKGDPIEEAHAALQAVNRGETYHSQCAAELLARSAQPQVALSERQHTILQFVAGGCSNKEIAYRMNISPPTVSFHLAEIRRKLGAENSRQVVDRALAAGLLTRPAT
ncbi:response regulator [Altererythrobacter aerius]|uniref:Response regulator n=1 Tax=Tsuneonella aeria TaxID=1837929 RepID=A0A6I4TE98_9SPHN|nr:response regulator transcription factor [Tsuneonella aeria]MXO75114.1 response regulator [Tsuneonella aeria]